MNLIQLIIFEPELEFFQLDRVLAEREISPFSRSHED